ncbi:MAG: hypothetical protein GY838_07290, partial [bacterium]|nr:hypothetical protein [bacterium]
MTTNPNSDSEEKAGQDVTPPATPEENTSEPETKPEDEAAKPVEEPKRQPAAEVLPTPAAPRLSTDYDPESIVNLDF